MQAVGMEEEIQEEGGALEVEVDGNKGKTIILMLVGFVVDMGMLQNHYYQRQNNRAFGGRN